MVPEIVRSVIYHSIRRSAVAEVGVEMVSTMALGVPRSTIVCARSREGVDSRWNAGCDVNGAVRQVSTHS
jgi:hypothetical protein